MENAKFLTAILFVLLISVPGMAQPPSDEAQIQRLRVNIERLVANAPPPDVPDQGGFRSTLQSLRNQLRDLLVEKRGALKNRIQNLEAPDALPEVLRHVQEIRRDLEVVNNEIAVITTQLGVAVGIVVPPPFPAQPAPQVAGPQNDNPPGPGFDRAVADLSTDELKDAAAPPEVAASEAVVPCGIDGRPTGNLFSQLDLAICDLARELNDDEREITIAQDQINLFTILTAKLLKTKTSDGESYATFVTTAQEQRVDQQIGAEPTTGGGTSLISKGGIPYLFGLAVENGAATQSQKDTNLTFRFNPGGVLNLFREKGFITGFQGYPDDPFQKFLQKTSIGLTYDTDRGDTTGVFTGTRQQLAAVSARIEFLNERDPRHKKYEAEWERFVADQAVKLSDEVWNTTIVTVDFGDAKTHKAFRDPALQAWLIKLNESLAAVARTSGDATSINAVAKLLRERSDVLPVERVSDETVKALTSFAKQDKQYTDAKNRLLDKIARGKLFTLDYINKREINASDTSTFNFIAATGTGARVDLTANGSFTFFHKRSSAVALTSARPGRVRDFQFAGQVTVPFKVGDSQFDLWFSGRYERLLEDAETLAGTTIPGTKGDIAVGQFGLNLPVPGLGMKFPVSFTFANRTELVKEKEIRGNFGFTFNWDTLFSKLKPF
ncbi:MAG TPA: hypothetical protein VIT88_13335 [Pyrinomonadaceae bacterium]